MKTLLMDVYVYGKPAAQGSKRHVGGGRMVEQSKAVAPWRALVSWTVSQAWKQPPMDGPVSLFLEFVMPRPTSTPKRYTPPAIKRPDADKLCRSIFDAITGICFKDDSQVVQTYAVKRLAEVDENPGCRIRVGVAGDLPDDPPLSLAHPPSGQLPGQVDLMELIDGGTP